MARPSAVAAPQDLRFYGGQSPAGIVGGDTFLEHDPAAVWDDQGVAHDNVTQDFQSLQDMLTQVIAQTRDQQLVEVKAYGAHQVRDAVLDYGSNAYVDLALMPNGQLGLYVDLSNEAAQLRPFYDLGRVLMDAAQQAEEVSDIAFLRGLASMIEAVSHKIVTVKAPATVPQPVARPVRRASLAPPAAPLPPVRQARHQEQHQAVATPMPIVTRATMPQRGR